MKALNFACGDDIREGWDNCDWQESNNVIHCNANQFPYPFEDDTYDYIELKQCLTLFDNPRWCLLELHRICKPGAIINIEVAHYTNKGAYTDLDTKHWFNDQTFIKLVEDNCRIDKEGLFEIQHLELTPTSIGKYIPFKRYLSLFINGLYSQIHVALEVKK